MRLHLAPLCVVINVSLIHACKFPHSHVPTTEDHEVVMNAIQWSRWLIQQFHFTLYVTVTGIVPHFGKCDHTIHVDEKIDTTRV